MPDHDLSPAAQAFILDLAPWLPKDELERARAGLAGLLKEEREPVRIALEWISEAEAEFYTEGLGRLPKALYPWAGVLRSIFETAREALKGDNPPARPPRFALFGGERWTAHGGWLDFIRFAETLEDALPREGETMRRHGEERPVVWWEVFDLKAGKAVAASIPQREAALRKRGLWLEEKGATDAD